MTRASGLALACGLIWAAQPSPLKAQGFQGTSNVALGAVSISENVNETVIAVNSAEAIIDWTISPAGAPAFDFLPEGKSAQFGGAASDFTVLNRITADNQTTPLVNLMGAITTSTSGLGNVWFSAPGGLFVGPNATFDVGSLLLTSNRIETDGDSGLFGANGEIRFRGVDVPLSTVSIATGAVIETNAANSYVALVAPRVIQAGSLRVDGSTAMVAAEEVDMTFNAGLFDITVTQGTTDTNGIVHVGSTGGPGTIDIGDVQRVVLMAVPKNQALTMLLSGSIGYDAAASASDDASGVVLSGGYDLAGDNHFSRSANSVGASNIHIGDAIFTSQIGRGEASTAGVASGTIAIEPSFGGNTSFQRNIALHGDEGFAVTAIAGSSVLFGGESTRISSALAGVGSAIFLLAQGDSSGQSTAGTITATGALALSAVGAFEPFGSGGQDAAGGGIVLNADGGGIGAGTLSLDVGARGEDGSEAGGNGRGGSVDFIVAGSGAISAQSIIVDASGLGGSGVYAGGKGTGGVVTLDGNGGLFDVPGLSIDARGFGGDQGDTGGDAAGGKVTLNISAGHQIWDFLEIDASAVAGLGFFRGGQAIADSAAISLVLSGPGWLDIADDLALTAKTIMPRVVDSGVQGIGGGISLSALNGGKLTVGGTFSANANAEFNAEIIPGDGDSPAMFGGAVSILASGNANFDLHDILLSANAASAIGTGASGSAQGGSVTMGATSGATIAQRFNGEEPRLSMRAVGLANAGPNAANGTGGTVLLYAEDGFITTGEATLDASARIGNEGLGEGGNGGTVRGGNATVEIRAGTARNGSIMTGKLRVWADGLGIAFDDDSDGIPQIIGNGGAGLGGNATLRQQAGSFTAADVEVSAEGYGSISERNQSDTLGFNSGAGTGGVGLVRIDGGVTSIEALAILARGNGGSAQGDAMAGQGAAHGGDGIGGTAELRVLGGSLGVSGLSRITINAEATGGNGMSSQDTAAGQGGSAQAGTARFEVGGVGSFVGAPGLNLLARGLGGSAGSSTSGPQGLVGLASGGTTSVAIGDGGFTLGDMSLNSGAIGGSGDVGGNAVGGRADFNLTDVGLTSLPSGFARAIGALSLTASGIAGFGSSANGTSTAGAISADVATSIPDSGLTVGGSFSASALGSVARAGDAITLSVSGQPFTVSTDATIEALGPIRIAASTGTEAPFQIANDLIITTPTIVIGTGRIIVGGDSAISGTLGIDLEKLRTTGTTNLAASSGSVRVRTDLQSFGDATVTGLAIDLASAGSVAFGALASPGDIILTLAGSGRFHQALDAGGALSISTGGLGLFDGPVNATGSATISIGTNAQFASGLAAGGALAFTGGGNASFAGGVSAEDIVMDIGGNADFAQALGSLGMIDIETGGDATFASIFASGPMTFDIGGDGVFSIPIETSGDLRVDTGGAATFIGGIFANTVAIGVGTDGDFQDSIRALKNLTLTTGGIATFASDVSAETIDMRIGGDASFLKTLGANSLGFASLGDATFSDSISALSVAMNIGGDARFLSNLDSETTLNLLIGGEARFAAGVSAGGAATFDIGGDARLDAALRVSGPLCFSAVGSTIFAGPVSATTGLFEIDGDVDFQGSLTLADDLNLSTDGSATFADVVSAGSASLGVGSAAVFQSSLSIGGRLTLATGGAATFATALGAGSIFLDIGMDLIVADIEADGTLHVLTGGRASFGGDIIAAEGDFEIGGAADMQGDVAVRDTLRMSVGGDGIFAGLASASGVSIDIGGDALFQGLLRSADTLDLVVDGNARFAGVEAADTTIFDIGGDVLFGAALDLPDLLLKAGGSARFAGPVVADSLSLDIGKNAQFDGALGTAGQLKLKSGGGAGFGGAVSGNPVILDIGTTATFAQGLTSAGILDIRTGGPASLQAVKAGAAASIRTGGNLLIGGDVTTGGTLGLVSGGSLSLGGSVSAAGLALSVVTDALFEKDLTLGAPLNLSVTGNLIFGGRLTGTALSLTSGGDMRFNAGLALSGALTIDAGRDVDLSGPVTVGSATISAARDARFNVSFTSADTLDLTAGGVARFTGPSIDGRLILVRSADIEIGGETLFGTSSRTQSIVLRPHDTGATVFVGGAARTGGYSLSNGEFARLRASDYVEISQSSTQADRRLEVGDLTISAAANGQLGRSGRLVLGSSQAVSVTGKIDFGAAEPEATLLIEGVTIRVHRDTGGINVHGADNSLQGQLRLSGERIEVASEATFADLANLTDPAAIRTRLALVEGGANEDGALRAGRITLFAQDRLVIQNSGATAEAADRRGFTANRLDILGSQRTVGVAINGRLSNEAGGYHGGLATTDRILFGDPESGKPSRAFLAPGSSVNGCIIGANCAPITEAPLGALPPADTISAIIAAKPSEPDAFQMTPIQLGDATVLDTGPIVDEPVTSVGNDDLWLPGCDPASPEGCSSAGE